MCRGDSSGPSRLQEYGSLDPTQAQLHLNGVIHNNHRQHVHERCIVNNGASTRLSRTRSAYTYGCVTGIQPVGACWGRLGTSASVQAGLGRAMDTWRHKLAPAMTLGPPSTSCCLRKSRDMYRHPVPAGGTSTSAGEVCSSHHQGRSYNEPESECGREGKTTNQGARRSPGTGLSFQGKEGSVLHSRT